MRSWVGEGLWVERITWGLQLSTRLMMLYFSAGCVTEMFLVWFLILFWRPQNFQNYFKKCLKQHWVSRSVFIQWKRQTLCWIAPGSLATCPGCFPEEARCSQRLVCAQDTTLSVGDAKPHPGDVHQGLCTHGSASIMGNAFSCILDGRLKPMA